MKIKMKKIIYDVLSNMFDEDNTRNDEETDIEKWLDSLSEDDILAYANIINARNMLKNRFISAFKARAIQEAFEGTYDELREEQKANDNYRNDCEYLWNNR